MQTKNLMALVAGAVLALAANAAPAPAAAAPAADAKKPEMYDEWRMNCQTPKDAKAEICELDRPLVNVLGKDPNDATKVRAQLLATIGVVRMPGSDKPQLLVKAPLGSLLSPPVLKVPGHKDISIPYLFCDQSGCTSIAIGLEKEFLDAVKAAEALETTPDASQGVLVLALRVDRPDQPPRPEGVNVKFGLKGFTKGLEVLNKKAAAAAPAKADAKADAKKDEKKKSDDKKKK